MTLDWKKITEANGWYEDIAEASCGAHRCRIGRRRLDGVTVWEYRHQSKQDAVRGMTTQRHEAVSICCAYIEAMQTVDALHACTTPAEAHELSPHYDWNAIDAGHDLREAGFVVVYAGGMAFVASLCFQNDGEYAWVAHHEGMHPLCWTDGRCWRLNAENEPSAPVTHWMPVPFTNP